MPTKLKAIVAAVVTVVGGVATALLQVFTTGTVQQVLTVVVAICTALAATLGVYRAPYHKPAAAAK